jgi:hypothetical protein
VTDRRDPDLGTDRVTEVERVRIGAVELELPERGTGVRAARRAGAAPTAVPEPVERGSVRTGPTRAWMLRYVAALAVVAVLAGDLAAFGISTLRDSNAGRRVASANPDEPGFEGLLEPTPTLLVLHVSDGVLRTAAMLALTNEEKGGSVLVVPPTVEVRIDLSTLVAGHAAGATPEDLRNSAELVTGVGIQEVVEIDDARLAELVAPVAPLQLDSPVAVGDVDAGSIELSADDVGPWLAARGDGESDEDASYRVSLVWGAWLEAVAASDDPQAVPGELESGISRYIAGLAAGPVRTAVLPVDEAIDPVGEPVLRVDREAIDSMITDLVPYPTASGLAPRTLVRMLDGTGDDGHVASVTPIVVASASSVVVVGNAESFDYETTEIRYHQPAQKDAAERLAAALGVGQVIEDVRPIDAFDVTIVLGTDI